MLSLQRSRLNLPTSLPSVLASRMKLLMGWHTSQNQSVTAFVAADKRCAIFVISDKRFAIHGSITTHNRENPTDNSGFVFVKGKGKVYGTDDVYLGREKGPYSRTIFAKTYLCRTIVRRGWTDLSSGANNSENLFQAEFKIHGPRAETDY